MSTNHLLTTMPNYCTVTRIGIEADKTFNIRAVGQSLCPLLCRPTKIENLKD